MKSYLLPLLFSTAAHAAVVLTATEAGHAITSLSAHPGMTTLESPSSPDSSQMQLRASRDGSNAALRWGTPFESDGESLKSLAFTASAPLDKENEFTRLRDLDGFADAFSFQIKYTDTRLWAKPAAKSTTPTNSTTFTTLAGRDVTPLASPMAALFGQNHLYVWGVTGTVGYKKFDFLKEPTLADGRRKTTPAGASVYGGLYLPDKMLLAARFEFQDAFESAAKKSFALPLGTNGLQEVKTGAYGAPQSDRKRLWTVEFRQKLSRVSYSIRATYDDVDGVFGVSVPIYIVQAEKASGALELGWSNHKQKDKDKFTVAIVVGAAFGFTP